MRSLAREQLSSARRARRCAQGLQAHDPRQGGTEGKLFGSIGTSDIAEACTRAGLKVARSEVRLPTGPLRTVGEHTVELHLHADIDVPLPMAIVAEE